MREFSLVDGEGNEYSLTVKEVFLHKPQGLGFEHENTYRQVGSRFIKVNSVPKQSIFKGTICFSPDSEGTDSTLPYFKYQEFIEFCGRKGLKLLYRLKEMASRRVHRLTGTVLWPSLISIVNSNNKYAGVYDFITGDYKVTDVVFKCDENTVVNKVYPDDNTISISTTSSGITGLSVSLVTFEKMISSSGTYVFIRHLSSTTSSLNLWKIQNTNTIVDIKKYGITWDTMSPVQNDTITIVYTKAENATDINLYKIPINPSRNLKNDKVYSNGLPAHDQSVDPVDIYTGSKAIQPQTVAGATVCYYGSLDKVIGLYGTTTGNGTSPIYYWWTLSPGTYYLDCSYSLYDVNSNFSLIVGDSHTQTLATYTYPDSAQKQKFVLTEETTVQLTIRLYSGSNFGSGDYYNPGSEITPSFTADGANYIYENGTYNGGNLGYVYFALRTDALKGHTISEWFEENKPEFYYKANRTGSKSDYIMPISLMYNPEFKAKTTDSLSTEASMMNLIYTSDGVQTELSGDTITFDNSELDKEMVSLKAYSEIKNYNDVLWFDSCGKTLYNKKAAKIESVYRTNSYIYGFDNIHLVDGADYIFRFSFAMSGRYPTGYHKCWCRILAETDSSTATSSWGYDVDTLNISVSRNIYLDIYSAIDGSVTSELLRTDTVSENYSYNDSGYIVGFSADGPGIQVSSNSSLELSYTPFTIDLPLSLELLRDIKNGNCRIAIRETFLIPASTSLRVIRADNKKYTWTLVGLEFNSEQDLYLTIFRTDAPEYYTDDAENVSNIVAPDYTIVDYYKSDSQRYERLIEVNSVEKTELEKTSDLECNVSFECLEPWGDPFAVFADHDGTNANEMVFQNDSNIESPVDLYIEGPTTNPSWSITVDGVEMETGGYIGTIENGETLLIRSKDGENGIYLISGSGNYTDVYQNSDFSKERFMHIRAGENVIIVTDGDNPTTELDCHIEGEVYYESV